MATIMGTLVPTPEQLDAALDVLRERLEARSATDDGYEDSLALWDVPSGARVVIDAFHDDLLSWRVIVKVFCRSGSVIDTCHVVPPLECDLRGEAGRESFLRHIRWAEGVHRDIERAPDTPEGPYQFLQRLTMKPCPEQVFAWEERDGRFYLQVRSPLPIILDDVVESPAAPQEAAPMFLSEECDSESPAPDPAAAKAYVEAMYGGIGTVVDVVCNLKFYVQYPGTNRPPSLEYTLGKLRTWQTEGVAPEACESPDSIMLQLVHALLAESQRPTGVK